MPTGGVLVALTREDELLLHDVDISAGSPDSCAQHDLLWVVATHPTHSPPVITCTHKHTHTQTALSDHSQTENALLQLTLLIKHSFLIYNPSVDNQMNT